MNKKFGLDQLGMCASALCIIHCMALPFLLILGMDTMLWWTENEAVELTLIGLALGIGLISFVGGYLRHKQHFVPVLFLAGILLIINGESVAVEWQGILLSSLGAAITIYAHFNNYKLRRYVA